MVTPTDAADDGAEAAPNDVLRPIDAITDGAWPAVLTVLAGIVTIAIVVVIAIGFANS